MRSFKHLEQMRRSNATLRARRKAEGKCAECEEPALVGWSLCGPHVERRRKFAKLNRQSS